MVTECSILKFKLQYKNQFTNKVKQILNTPPYTKTENRVLPKIDTAGDNSKHLMNTILLP